MKTWLSKDSGKASQATSPGSAPPSASFATVKSRGPEDAPEVLAELLLDEAAQDGNSELSEWGDDDEEEDAKPDLIEDSSSLPEASTGASALAVPEEDNSVDDKSVTSAATSLAHKPLKMSYSFWGKRKFGSSGGARKSVVRVHVRKKEVGELSRLLCVQALVGVHAGPIWVCEWSTDGTHMASAGKDGRILVWQVLPSPHMSNHSPKGDGGSGGGESQSVFAGVVVLGPPLFAPHPVKAFAGHTADVTSVAWNQSGFVISGSVDKTARVWHLTTTQCLAVLAHPDFVSGVDMHPTDDSLALTGCLDKQLRLWDLATGQCLRVAQTPALITCVKFNLAGDRAIAGLMNGNVFFFQADKLRYYTQVECRGSKGLRKVTSLRCFKYPGAAREMLLVTCNDNRTRLYSMDDFSLACKYRGALNSGRLPIGARCSDDGSYLLCGSEDRQVVLWRTRNDHVKSIFGRQGRRDMCDTFEAFHACGAGAVTVACFAPVGGGHSHGHSGSKGGSEDGLAGAFIVTASEGTIAVFENERV